MRVKDQVVDGDRAYVLANYDFSLPNGKKVNGDVVEAIRSLPECSPVTKMSR